MENCYSRSVKVGRAAIAARRNLARLLLWMLVPLSSFAQEPRTAFPLEGIVRDPAGVTLADATVFAKSKSGDDVRKVLSSSDGRYLFSLPAGVYALSAIKAGFEASPIVDISIPENHKKIELKLGSAKGTGQGSTADSKLQFFDQPQFTVSGVTDTSNLGGHGSNVVLKARESLAKDAASLGKSPEAKSASDTAQEKSLREAQGRDPANIEGNQRLGKFLFDIGRSAEAIPYLERVLQSKPGDYTATYQLALANAHAGNLDRARSSTEALLSSRDTAELHHLLADIEEKAAHHLEAVRQYQKAAEMEPNEPYLFDWGSELLLHHAPEPAIDVFSRAHRAHPDSVRLLVGLGAAWFARGSYADAARTLCQASDLDPQDPSPYIFLGRMQRSEATVPKEVVGKLQRFVSLHPNSAEAQYFYAVALWKSRTSGTRDATAIEIESALRKAITVDPNFALAHFQLGVLHSEESNDAEAMKEYRRAVELDPQLEEAHYRLSRMYRKAGESDKAKEELHLYDQCVKESEQRAERERHEIPQFVYTLRDSQTR